MRWKTYFLMCVLEILFLGGYHGSYGINDSEQLIEYLKTNKVLSINIVIIYPFLLSRPTSPKSFNSPIPDSDFSNLRLTVSFIYTVKNLLRQSANRSFVIIVLAIMSFSSLIFHNIVR